MTNCTAAQIEFPAFKRRKIEAQFSGGAITSDCGVLLLRSFDQQLKLTERVAAHLPDPRAPERVRHQVVDLLQHLYEKVYCARGEMENRIKEQQLDLFADRTSCSLWWPNQFRLLLSTLAYTLINAIRSIALQDTELAQATCATIRLKLFKIGAVVIRNTRRIRLLLSSHYPYQALFHTLCQQLCPS